MNLYTFVYIKNPTNMENESLIIFYDYYCRYYIQSDNEKENIVLYSESDHPMCWYIFPYSSCILFAIRFW